jgi:hypothetical protein
MVRHNLCDRLQNVHGEATKGSHYILYELKTESAVTQISDCKEKWNCRIGRTQRNSPQINEMKKGSVSGPAL